MKLVILTTALMLNACGSLDINATKTTTTENADGSKTTTVETASAQGRADKDKAAAADEAAVAAAVSTKAAAKKSNSRILTLADLDKNGCTTEPIEGNFEIAIEIPKEGDIELVAYFDKEDEDCTKANIKFSYDGVIAGGVCDNRIDQQIFQREHQEKATLVRLSRASSTTNYQLNYEAFVDGKWKTLSFQGLQDNWMNAVQFCVIK